MENKVSDAVKSTVYKELCGIAAADIDWQRLRGKNVLITGAAGFMGFYMTAGLLAANDLYGYDIHVTALVRNEKKARERFGRLCDREDLSLIVQDVCQPISCAAADFIVHMASHASAIEYETDPVGTMSANMTGAANVMELARNCGSEAVLVISSMKVYGQLMTGRDSIDEGDIGYVDHTSYKNCYAVAKRASETLAASYNKQYGVHVKIARPSYVYGASSLDDDRVWAQFIANIVKREDILLKSSGAANRSFVYVTDTVTALLTILLRGEDITPYNISSDGSNITIRGFARTACEAFPERSITLSFADPADAAEPEPYKPGDPTPEIMDNSRLLSLGWRPAVDIKEGVRRAVAILEEKDG